MIRHGTRLSRNTWISMPIGVWLVLKFFQLVFALAIMLGLAVGSLVILLFKGIGAIFTGSLSLLVSGYHHIPERKPTDGSVRLPKLI